MVRSGFKKSEIGEIPKDWDVVALGPFVDITSGESPSKFKIVDSGTPYFKVEQLNNDPKYATRTEYFITDQKSVPADSIVFPKRGASIFQNKIRIFSAPSYMDTNLMALTCKDGLSPQYLFYQLSYVGLDEVADTTSVPQINNKHIKPFKIAKPEPNEQNQIANALSDVDGLIAGLEALVAKKRDLKTATMQQLLTGRARLPGFGGEWGTVTIGKDAKLFARIGWQALTTKEYLDSGNFFLVTGTDFDAGAVDWSRCSYVDEWRYSQDRKIQLREGDVLVTKDGTIGKAGFVPVLPGPATLNSGVFVIRPVDGAFAPKFLFHILTSRVFDDFIDEISAGSTITHLYQKDFVKFSFQAPDPDEQAAIAEVLDAIDDDIRVTGVRLKKANALKQGMMQELLTGRTRLI